MKSLLSFLSKCLLALPALVQSSGFDRACLKSSPIGGLRCCFEFVFSTNLWTPSEQVEKSLSRQFRFMPKRILAIYLFCGYLGAQTVNVPLSHWIYDILERWETQGYIENVYDHTKPYSRMEVAEYLSQMSQAYQNNPGKFSDFDREYLNYCASEFAEELDRLDADFPPKGEANRFRKWKTTKPLSYIIPDFVYRNNRNFLNKSYREFTIFVDPILQLSNTEVLSTSDTVYQTNHLSNGVLFRGHLGDKLGFYFNFTDNHLSREPDYPVQDVLEESGWPWLTNRTGESIDFDENAAYLTYTHKYFSLLFGRDYNQWGSGHRAQMVLSTNSPIYDQFKLTVQYWRFKFTHLTAFLQYVPPEARRSLKSVDPIDVYWAGNRLEMYLGKGIQLGLTESIIYGNQSFRPGYHHPLAFFTSIEHFYGDRDNTQLSIDLAWRVWPGAKIYGEWFIDDITTSKLGSEWFGNKFGWQGGLFLVDLLPFIANDFLLEYTRIKPYVYTHSFKDFNKYKHYDTILGHYIGPNSDDLFLRFRSYPQRRLRLQLNLEAYRHGSNPADRNVGGDPDLPHRAQDSDNVTLLDGRRIERTAFGGEIRYEILRNTFLTFKLHQIDTNNVGQHTTFSFRIGYNWGHRDEVIRPFQTARE